MATTIHAVLRKDRTDSAGNAPIMIRITIDKKHTYHQIGERVPIKYWMPSGKVATGYPNANLINAKIEKRLAEIKNTLLKEELQDNLITQETAKKAVQFKKASKFNVYSYWEKLLTVTWPGVKKPGTIRQSKGDMGKMKKFAPKLRFEEVTPEWLGRYESYMRNELKNKDNTVHKSFKIFRTVLNCARKEGVYKEYPFINFNVPGEKYGNRAHLTSKELAKFTEIIMSAQLQPAQRIAGSFFIFSCYTGLRFGDCEKFNSSNHITDNKRIYLSMSKTSDTVSLIITNKIREALEIIKPYEGKLPSNTECNRAVKEIAKKAGIKKSLSFHCARHTFGYMCAENNMPIEITQKLMGHKSSKITQVYYHISNANVDQWLTKLHSK